MINGGIREIGRSTMLAVFCLLFGGYNMYAQHTVTLQYTHQVKGKVLALDTGIYENSLGQSFSISNFKYYIGQIILTDINGIKTKPSDYFLIDETDEGSKKIVLEGIPDGHYVALSFIVGVDSVHNCSGAQSGALDPVNGMFWAWNTGYIFLKLEGHAPSSTAAGHLLEYHVGGFRQPYNNIQSVTLPLDKDIVTLSAKEAVQLNVTVEIAALLDGIDFSKEPSIADAAKALKLSQQEQHMFSVTNTQTRR